MRSLSKKQLLIAGICLLVLVIGVFVGYRIYLSVNTVVIWGEFRVPKSQLTLARVDVTDGGSFHAFEIHDHESVLQIAREVSHMQRLDQITPTNFPPAPHYKPVFELQIVTKKYGSCGGSFWSIEPNGTIVWQDSDGYYWNVPKSLIDSLKEDIHSSTTTKLF